MKDLQPSRQKPEDLVNFALFLSLVNEELLGVYMHSTFGVFPFFFLPPFSYVSGQSV